MKGSGLVIGQNKCKRRYALGPAITTKYDAMTDQKWARQYVLRYRVIEGNRGLLGKCRLPLEINVDVDGNVLCDFID